MRALLLLSAAVLIGAAPPQKPKTPSDIVAQAPASAWRDIDPNDLLVMDLGTGGRVVIQLAPNFAPVHMANIRALAKGSWWTDWFGWLESIEGSRVKATGKRKPGERGDAVIEDAPGRYVAMR